jgi:type IV pilus assembly protein PilE
LYLTLFDRSAVFQRVSEMKSRGFTLIELMIAVAVVAIVLATALPAYNGYLNRAKIAEAVSGLADYRVRMEQFFQDNRNYGTASSTCPVAVPPSQSFSYACTVGSATPTISYTATAASLAGALGAAAGDYSFAINEANAKSTTKFKGVTVTKSCWLLRGSEC